MPLASVFTRGADPRKLFNRLGTLGCGSVREAPADFVALGSRPQFTLLALGRRFKCSATAHLFKDALGIQFCLEALESPVDGLAFFHSHSTHAMIVFWLVGFCN